MRTDIKKAYSETFEILQLLGDEFIDKIPNKFMEFLEKEKDNNYNVSINPVIPLEDQNLLEDTINILAMLKLDYWCKDKEEKDELKRILIENEKNYQEKLRENYNPDNIFNKVNNEKLENQQLPIKLQKDTFYRKIIILLKKILHINK